MESRFTIITAALMGVMAALVAVTTFAVQIYIPATKGYLNFGDIMIFVSALTFGPVVGGFAGGVGSAISDVLGGYAYFAPSTLVVKGVEGFIAGLIANRISYRRDVLAVIIAGAEMITGYFLAEFFPLQEGWAALGEVPANILQIVVGGLVGLPIALIIRRRLPEILKPTKVNDTDEIRKPLPQLKS
ncbi:MAG: ECF transporter S component [Candidatus Bathyarchaeia archaeon]